MIMREEKKECVYFFKHVGLSPVKIGYSTNESPINRFEQFKTYAPFGAELIGFIITKNAKKLETELHQKYSRDRIKGEWFEITKNDVEKCIKFYSNLNDIEEKNSFQIAWAKSKNKLYSNDINDYSIIFLQSYSLTKKDSFEEVITNQYEVSVFLNIEKSKVKKIFYNLELKNKSYKIRGNVKSGVKLYKKVE